MDQQAWERLSPEEKKEELYLRQVRVLQTFLQHGAISQEQFEKSFHDLTEKMGMQHVKESSSLDPPHQPVLDR